MLYLWSFCAVSFFELGKKSKVTFMVIIVFSNHEYLIWPLTGYFEDPSCVLEVR